MRQLLAPILALHWMTVFALAAGLLALGGSDRVASLFALMGVLPHAGGLPAALEGSAPLLLSIGFALVAVLFLWVALDGVVGAERKGDEGGDVAPVAFAGATVMLTAVLVYGVTLPVSGLLRATMTALAALLASFLAIAAESWISRSRKRDKADAHPQIQAMAADAVRQLRLSHIAGRLADRTPGGER